MHQARFAVRQLTAVLVGLTPPAWLLWAAAAWSRDLPLSGLAAVAAAVATTLLALCTALALVLEQETGRPETGTGCEPDTAEQATSLSP